jgi:hypothetical protein
MKDCNVAACTIFVCPAFNKIFTVKQVLLLERTLHEAIKMPLYACPNAKHDGVFRPRSYTSSFH